MDKIYYNLIKQNLKNIDDVYPESLREKVQALLEKDGE
jgi:hypothetical protein